MRLFKKSIIMSVCILGMHTTYNMKQQLAPSIQKLIEAKKINEAYNAILNNDEIVSETAGMNREWQGRKKLVLNLIRISLPLMDSLIKDKNIEGLTDYMNKADSLMSNYKGEKWPDKDRIVVAYQTLRGETSSSGESSDDPGKGSGSGSDKGPKMPERELARDSIYKWLSSVEVSKLDISDLVKFIEEYSRLEQEVTLGFFKDTRALPESLQKAFEQAKDKINRECKAGGTAAEIKKTSIKNSAEYKYIEEAADPKDLSGRLLVLLAESYTKLVAKVEANLFSEGSSQENIPASMRTKGVLALSKLDRLATCAEPLKPGQQVTFADIEKSAKDAQAKLQEIRAALAKLEPGQKTAIENLLKFQ